MIAGAARTWKAVPFAQRRMILLLVATVALANVAQPYPDLAPLQHGPTLTLGIAAPWLLRRWPISNKAAACLLLFLLLHTFAARWIYSYVPYDDWARVLIGKDISGLTGAERNGFDRLVHFAFGALLTFPIGHIVERYGRVRQRLAILFAFCAVGFGSAVYEIFEWLLTIIAAPDMAEYYNGQQGDMWDAQKDMALAQLGSLCALVPLLWRRRPEPVRA